MPRPGSGTTRAPGIGDTCKSSRLQPLVSALHRLPVVTSRAAYSTPSSLHAVLGSIVAATLAGCSGKATPAEPATGGEEGRVVVDTTQVTSTTTDAAPVVDRQNAALVCLDAVPSRVQGLAPDYMYDSLAYYSGWSGHARTPPEFGLIEVAGTPCASAPDAAACLAQVERVRANAATWWHYDDFFSSTWTLLLATGLRGPDLARLDRAPIVPRGFGYDESLTTIPVSPNADAGVGDAGEVDAAAFGPSPVTTIDDIDELLAFLGTIDTPNEAALVMFAHWRPLTTCSMERDGQDFVASGTWQISDCPITRQRFELRVTPSGVFSEVAMGEPESSSTCVGRRPDGLCAAIEQDAAESAGDWLARTARLEAAAVAAFVLLARELDALGAPPALIARLKHAARDEIQHAEHMTTLARARGAQPAPAVVVPHAGRSLIEIALENAVEGCVRECWGALCASFQATTAQAPDVRAVFARIAREEAEHAQLSRDIAAWLDTRLDAAERARVAAAREQAIADLRRELDVELPPSWCSELGLPTREQALAALDALDDTGLLRAA